MNKPIARLAGVVVGVASLVTMSPCLSAQGGSSWMQISLVEVVPEGFDDYVELQLQEVTPGLQKASVPWRSVWRAAEFGNAYEMTLVMPVTNLAEYDSGGPLARSIPPDRLQRLRTRLRRLTVSHRSYLVRYRPELSVESDDISALSLARVSRIEVAPGRGTEWENFLRDNLPKFRTAGVVFGAYEWMFGPGPTAWHIVENYASFAELEQPSMVARAYGDQASNAASRLAGVLVSIERYVLRYDAELSYSAIPSGLR